uniref:WD repeat domain 55 n=1 Tax=Pundamilia nyererei TaxID=303518 RepID=A0A3B4H7S8_9CICH
MDLKHHEDYISDITVDQAKRILLTASGDGTMGVFNIKRRRFELLSEYQSGDLTSVALMKRGKKVVCGSSEGTIYIFNWNGFGATSDRFALKAESIDQILPITDSIMCTASTDGYISALVLFGNIVDNLKLNHHIGLLCLLLSLKGSGERGHLGSAFTTTYSVLWIHWAFSAFRG